MTDATKNGTKPKMTPFRLLAKPSIKDAPIFDDIPFTKKKRKLSFSKSKKNDVPPVERNVEKSFEHSKTSGIAPTGKTTPTFTRGLSGGVGKVFGDPLKYNVADPFAIMTAEPDEDETVDDNLTVETEKESVKEELVGATVNHAKNSGETETVETADKLTAKAEKAESVESVEIESGHSKGENEVVDSVNVGVEQIQKKLEADILEIDADIDSSTLRDTDDIFDDNLTEKDEKERGEKKGGKEKKRRKHKRSEKHETSEKHEKSERHSKGEKKKKRRKEKYKSEDDGHDKRHKKRRRVSRSRDRSRSLSSSKRRRRSKSRDRSLNKSIRGSNRRDLPQRSSRQRSRSRSPMRRTTTQNRDQVSVSPKRRGKEQSPSRKRSQVGSVEKTVREKSPRSKKQREKTSEILNERSPKRLSRKSKSDSENRRKGKSPKSRNKSTLEKSPKKRSASRTSIDSTRKKSDSDDSASFVQVPIASPGGKSTPDNDAPEVKESDAMLYPDVKKSPISESQLKSYVHVVSKDPIPLVPYDEDIMSISPWDSADGLNVQSDKETPVQEAESQKAEKGKQSKHKVSDEAESGKKTKSKKKSKKSQEKKRKKKAVAKVEDLENAEKNTDDEFDDLLFTKTNKESKEEDVFNDSEVFSAKHNIRASVVDLDRKKVRTVGTPTIKDRKLSPLRKEPLQTKRLSPLRNERLKSKKPTSTAVGQQDSPEPYQPEKLSEISEAEVLAPDSLPEVSTWDEPPSQSGISTIPFLSHGEEPGLTDDVDQYAEGNSPRQITEDCDVEQPVENESTPYSPVEEPIESNDAPYSPVEEPVSDLGSPQKSSTMNLSDISTKDTVVKDAVGIITSTEKVEDFLDRIQPPEPSFDAVDMDMSSPASGMRANSEGDDDIIEQLHKEFVRTQHQDTQPGTCMDNHVTYTSSIQQVPENTVSDTNIPSPLHTAASDPIVQAYGLNKKYDTTMKSKRSKRSKQKKSKKIKEDNKPLAREKKDIEEALNRVHRQARVEDEMKHALKVYFKRKDITKDEYKMILRKGVPQVANSNHTIDPERIRSLVKKYVAKYKGSRERRAKHNIAEQQEIPFTFSP